ncbi:MAG: flagellar FlbD family protein [Planctomycetes bacterium]|nr:flagellar FlbD family protein [Planctomycetota bacterium]MBI3843062.1 flagellar FlbD family protein [Planctomycetota bacterium]
MIQVTRFDRSKYLLNAELIVRVEATPDTVITLANGDSVVVRDSCDEIVNRVLDYRRAVAATTAGALSTSLED